MAWEAAVVLMALLGISIPGAAAAADDLKVSLRQHVPEEHEPGGNQYERDMEGDTANFDSPPSSSTSTGDHTIAAMQRFVTTLSPLTDAGYLFGVARSAPDRINAGTMASVSNTIITIANLGDGSSASYLTNKLSSIHIPE